MTPVIGITTYEDQASWRNWSARAAILPYVYVDSVRRSGGRAVMLPPGGDDDEASATVAGLDGLVVTGGPDIEPVRYGAARHPRTQVPVTARDTWDLSITSHALRQGVPLLAICRGMAGAGLYVESAKGECNLGQHEIAFRYADAVTTCDNHSIYKTGAKEIAAQDGNSITFM